MNRLLSLPPLRRRLSGRVVILFLACVAGLSAIGSANAQAPAAATSPDAKAIVMRMADYMSKLPSFSVDVRDSYDTVQKNGQRIEYSETRKITVARPDRMRLEVVAISRTCARRFGMKRCG